MKPFYIMIRQPEAIWMGFLSAVQLVQFPVYIHPASLQGLQCEK